MHGANGKAPHHRDTEFVLALVRDDDWMMRVLKTVADVGLRDGWVGAGFVRNKVWDHLHGYDSPTPLNDVDVAYFDPGDAFQASDERLERCLMQHLPGVPWEVKNQARMHCLNDEPPYLSSEDAISRWPETATATALSLGPNGELRLLAPHGLGDLLGLRVAPTPHFLSVPGKLRIFDDRVARKRWTEIWPKLAIVRDESISE